MWQESSTLAGSPLCGHARLDGRVHPSRSVHITICIPCCPPLRLNPAINLVNCTSDYVYDRISWTFHQHQASREILERLLNVNPHLAGRITAHKEFSSERVPSVGRLPRRSNLTRLLELGIAEPTVAPEILEAVFEALANQTECAKLPCCPRWTSIELASGFPSSSPSMIFKRSTAPPSTATLDSRGFQPCTCPSLDSY